MSLYRTQKEQRVKPKNRGKPSLKVKTISLCHQENKNKRLAEVSRQVMLFLKNIICLMALLQKLGMHILPMEKDIFIIL